MGTLARGMEPGSLQRAVDERTDRFAVGKATARRSHPDQDLPGRAGRSRVTEVRDSGFATLGWPWEAILACALAPDAECPGVPR